jgi:tripartite ATP-independent transporter DctP family solute receptor
MRKKMLACFLGTLIALAVVGCSSGGGSEGSGSNAATAPVLEKSILIKLAHGAPEEHSSHQGFLKFKEIVEAESKGVMTVEIYPNNQMGGDREIVEGTQFGNITGGYSSQSAIAGFAKEFAVLDAPFMFKSREEVYKVFDGEAGEKLLNYFEGINIKGLGYAENGFRNLTCNKEIRNPNDLKGVKIRVMESEIQILTWSSLNANPTPMAFGELFTALQQKVVDAQENPAEFIYTNKFYEVQDYLMLTRHIYSPLLMFVNLDFYKNLTPTHRSLVDTASKEAIAHNRKIATENEVKALEAIKNDIKIVDLSEKELQTFKDKMVPVYEAIKKKVGNDELVNLFLK